MIPPGKKPPEKGGRKEQGVIILAMENTSALLFARIGGIERPGTGGPGTETAITPLSDGAFVTGVVARGAGNEVVLRLEDGGILHASTLGELVLHEGDTIEAVVDKSSGAAILRVLNQTPAEGRAPAVSQQAITGMLSVLRRNPEMNAAVARFLAENGLAVTAENAQALSQMTKGGGLGALLGQIVGLIGETGEGVPGQCEETVQITGEVPVEMHPLDGQIDGQTDGQAGKAVQMKGQAGEAAQVPTGELPGAGPVPPQETNSQAPALPQGRGGEDVLIPLKNASAQLDANAGGTVFQPKTAPQKTGENIPAFTLEILREAEPAGQQPGGVLAEQKALQIATEQGGTVLQNAEQPGGIPGQAPVNPEGVPVNGNCPGFGLGTEDILEKTAQGFESAQAKGQPQKEIGKLIDKLFVRPGEQDGKEIKKTMDDAPQTLKMLKSALDQSDIKSKNLCLKQVDQAVKQLEVAEKTQRFDYIQLPLTHQGEDQTAELFIFKGKKAKGGAEEGVTILIALDTRHIGRVETLLTAAKGAVSLEFRLEQEAKAAETFRQNSARLSETVEAAGFSLTGIRFAGLEKRTTLLNAGELAGERAEDTAPGIDIRI